MKSSCCFFSRAALLFTILLLCAISCQRPDPVEIKMQSSLIVGRAPLTVSFSANASGGVPGYSFEWDFGDAARSTQQNVSHTYQEGGVYLVNVLVSDNNGRTAQTTTLITVINNEAPAVSLSASPITGIAPLTVQFQTDVIDGELPAEFTWTFGDGSSSTEQSPTHTFQNSGQYNATLEMTDSTGESITEQITIEVTNNNKKTDTNSQLTEPFNFSASVYAGTVPMLVSFECTAEAANQEISFEIYPGDGSLSVKKDTNSYTYKRAGKHLAACTATDKNGKTMTKRITIDAMPIEPTAINVPENFSIVIVPDTQSAVAWKPAVLDAQINWIIENAASKNIRFVAHEGDLVLSNTLDEITGEYLWNEEWDIISEAMQRLSNAQINFGITPGNHDYLPNRNSDALNEHFPLSYFQQMNSFVGAFETNKSDNTYHYIHTTNKIDIMVLFLEFGPRTNAIEWAKDVINAHEDYRIIVITHGFLTEDGNILTSDNGHSPLYYKLNGDANDVETLLANLIKPMNAIDMIFSGHVGTQDDGSGYQKSLHPDNSPFYQFMVNYQYFPVNRSGFLRLIEFQPKTETVQITTYNPHDDTYDTAPDAALEITNFSLN